MHLNTEYNIKKKDCTHKKTSHFLSLRAVVLKVGLGIVHEMKCVLSSERAPWKFFYSERGCKIFHNSCFKARLHLEVLFLK